MRLSAALRRRRPVRSSRDTVRDVSGLLFEHATPEDRRIVEQALPYSMTGVARLLSVIDATRYCVAHSIPGAFAECGVWRGGSVLAMILTLQELAVDERDIYLYDTFEGMTAPTEADFSELDGSALAEWREASASGNRPWSEIFGEHAFSEEDVRSLLGGTAYPHDRVHFVRGPVEETVPAHVADDLALLRLDTDWYESTRHELIHLFPRLNRGGVLIIDDYGHWRGAAKAVDEYFASNHQPLLLSRVDYSARMGIKQ